MLIQRLTFLGGGVVLLGGCKKSEEPAATPTAKKDPRLVPLTTKHKSFTNDEYAVLAAACERLLPKDEDPGAVDADVPKFIDRILQTHEVSHMREDFVGGVNALDRRAQRQFKVPFAQATPAQQDQILLAFKNAAPEAGEAKFYEMLLVFTLEGFLGDPSYGGNKNKVGWALVGFNVVGIQAAAPGPGYDPSQHLHRHGPHGGH